MKPKGNQAQAPQSLLPVESCKLCLIPQQHTVTTHVKCWQPGELIRELIPRVVTQGWSHRHPLPNTCQNSRLPGRKWFSATRSVCIHSLGTPLSFRESLISAGSCLPFRSGSQMSAKGQPCKASLFFFFSFGLAAQHVESYFPDQGLNLRNPEPKPLDNQESPRQNFLKITRLRPVVLTLFCRGSSVRT